MKTSGMIRIIAGTLVAALLTWLLVAILAGQTIFHTTRGVITLGRSIFGDGMANNVVTGSGKASASEIREIEVEWAAGQVNVLSGSGTDITFEETCHVKLTQQQTMRYSINNGKLKIAYSASGLRTLSLLGLPAKTLTVTIPADSGITHGKIDVESASAEVSIRDVSADEIELDTASGFIRTEKVIARKLDVNTVSSEVEMKDFDAGKLDVGTTSGNLNLMGRADEVDIETVSGDVGLYLSNVPEKLEAEAVSGRVKVTVPEDAGGFTADVTTVSGSFRCEYPALQNGRHYVVGSGLAKFDLNTVSGDIIIGTK